MADKATTTRFIATVGVCNNVGGKDERCTIYSADGDSVVLYRAPNITDEQWVRYCFKEMGLEVSW